MLIFADFLLAVVISLILLLLGRRLNPGMRSAWLALVAAIAGCFLADAALLAALPFLHLSFGPVALPLFLISGARLVVFVPALLLLQRRSSNHAPAALMIVVALLQLALFAGEVDGFYIEPFRLGVSELPIQAPAFFPDRPLRILQISDLHVERTTLRERDVLAQVNRLQPDLIVLTGDFVNIDYQDDPLAIQDARSILLQLNAPYGVYAVAGTTDTLNIMATIFTGSNIRVLDDKMEIVSFPGGSLALLGVTNTPDWKRDQAALITLKATIPPDSYTIFLYHTPDLIEAASASGINLYFAGHTHGGQIRLPFYGALVTFSRYGKKYEMGQYQAGPTTLYVSRGIGLEGLGLPRVRFLCPPELVLAELGK